MKFIYLILLPLILTISSCGEISVKDDNRKSINSSEDVAVDSIELLRHVVLFNFLDETSEDKINEIENEFISLADKISEIHSFEWGVNNSPEGLDKGLTHCFLVTFLNEADRAKYLPHPEHQKFVNLIKPFIEDVVVVDYWKK